MNSRLESNKEEEEGVGPDARVLPHQHCQMPLLQHLRCGCIEGHEPIGVVRPHRFGVSGFTQHGVKTRWAKEETLNPMGRCARAAPSALPDAAPPAPGFRISAHKKMPTALAPH